MIPEAAVEAAARAMYDSTAHEGDWDDIATDGEKATGMAYARAAIEAAAPHLIQAAKAEAWDEGWDSFAGFDSRPAGPYPPNPYR